MFRCRPISIVRIVPRTASTTRRSMPRVRVRSRRQPPGLHFTPQMLARLRERGVESAEITLHVGLGTFQPVRTEVVEQHRLHTEHYEIPAQAAAEIERARREGRRIVAVGTTTVRTLEYAASRQNPEGRIEAANGRSRYLHLSGIRVSRDFGACSPISICRNRRCSCWWPLLPAVNSCCGHTRTQSRSVTASSPTATACSSSDAPLPERRPS